MFDFVAQPTFSADVPLSAPGRPEPWLVPFEFNHKGRKQLEAWRATWVSADGVARSDEDILADVIKSWGVKRAGELVPFTKTALADLLDTYPTAAREIRDAYLRELTESKRKNF
ncbi:MAG: hypothetical protein K0R58_237 [Ramlibacter sp.]|jgi:hypothetical protein|nr:hypothetical protein [Ramlibacter sp.]